MPTSPGTRQHRGAGASAEELAEWTEKAYPALRARRERHAGADRAMPLDPVADEQRRRNQ